MSYTNGLDKPSDYFATKLYVGNGSTQSITGVGFEPDWVWIKSRGDTSWHRSLDVVRGATKELYQNESSAENTEANGLTSFDSDGFSIGSNNGYNGNTVNFASWNWLAGGTASNSNGSITSTVSANTTAGFSIVSYTGNGSAGATVGHSLSQKPSIIITKRRDSTSNWVVYSSQLGATKYINLEQDFGSQTATSRWNDTEPTSSVFSVGTSTSVNPSSGTMIAYCFAEKKGYSKFGSYTGNGNSDGTFVYTGFKPALIIAKISSGSSDWRIYDNKRLGYNVDNNPIRINDSRAEETDDNIDFLSNGFKWRTTDGALNGSGSTYIYMCFASNPFVTSTGIPTTAR